MDVFNVNGASTDLYNIGGDSSSDEGAESSADDIDDLLNENHESDSDSFEKEMEMELNKEFMEHQKLYLKSREVGEQSSSKQDGSEDNTVKKDNVYDDAYFSSGSEDEDNVGGILSKSKERRKVKTDDELLYDPNMDEENEKWVREQRKGHQNKETTLDEEAISANGKESSSAKAKAAQNKPTCTKTVNSDAILSCPACLTTLCIDCQRHDIYKHQFRAMFVMNCNIISDETLRYEEKKDKKKSGKKNKKQKGETSAAEEVQAIEFYMPVQCTCCNTEVAVYDKEEVYHFFNVVESLS